MTTHWYARYPGDYAKDTQHLTLLEHGAYTKLMDYYYAHSRPLPANEDTNAPTFAGTGNPRLYIICGAITQDEQKAVDRVLHDFFYLKDGYWHQDRADREIAKRAEVSDKRRKARAARSGVRNEKGGAHTSANAGTNARANAGTNAHTTTTTTTTTDSKKKSIKKEKPHQGDLLPHSLLMQDGRFLSPDQFCDELWDVYPSMGRRKGSKKQFSKIIQSKIQGGIDYEKIRRGVARYAEYIRRTGELNANAESWARNERWEEDYTISATPDQSQAHHRKGVGSGDVHEIRDAAEKAKTNLQRHEKEDEKY